MKLLLNVPARKKYFIVRRVSLYTIEELGFN
jgi:hypothetical protein